MRKPLLLLIAVVACGACAARNGAHMPVPHGPLHDAAADSETDFHTPVHQGLLATLWVQTAAEYDALGVQAFRQAADQLDDALADRSWTAALEQTGSEFETLPPAVIVDVDETVLDNSPFEAQLIVDGAVYSEEAWAAWVETASAVAVPGAKRFLDLAAARGVTVFYVTNRDAEQETATRANLESHGFPLDPSRDVLLMKGERDWGSDKASRRREVAETHRILLLLGDDLNDFVSGARAEEPDARSTLASDHDAMWGRRWIVLPNPVYGSWEASLFGRDYSLSDAEKVERKKRHLEPYR